MSGPEPRTERRSEFDRVTARFRIEARACGDDGEHAERRDERRQAEPCNDHPIESRGDHAGNQAEGHRDKRISMRCEAAGDDRSEHHDGPVGEINPRYENDEGLPKRQRSDDNRLLRNQGDVAGVQKSGSRCREYDENDDQRGKRTGRRISKETGDLPSEPARRGSGSRNPLGFVTYSRFASAKVGALHPHAPQQFSSPHFESLDSMPGTG